MWKNDPYGVPDRTLGVSAVPSVWLGRLCPGLVQRGGQIGRQWRGHVDVGPGDRVGEGQARGVEELAGQAVAVAGAVLGVAADRMADCGQVHANLVGAPGLERDAE